MHKTLFIPALILILTSLTAKAFESPDTQSGDPFTINLEEWQDSQDGDQGANVFLPPRMHPNDRFMVTVFTDVWQNTPDEMDLKAFQRGVSIEALQDRPIGRSNFSLAAGLGFTSHNLYTDHLYRYNAQEDTHDFYPIQPDYDNNKLSLNYIDLPVQLRFRSRDLDNTFRLYAGIKAGYLVNAHTKYEGKAYFSEPGGIHFAPEDTEGLVERTTKVKEHKLENLNDFRIGLTAMVGYSRFNIHFSYPLTDIFEGNNAEEMHPISVGLTFILF